jgi:fructokinase
MFGEVVFDRFPDGSDILGGAPFNVAWHLRGFGENPLFISRVGDDEAGRRVRLAMNEWGMDTAGLQTDHNYPTGAVRIQLVDGEPHFDILPNQAYDYITLSEVPPLELAAFIYHGSLALRSAKSRATLESLVRRRTTSVFLDVNLREPWWSATEILRWMVYADWVKLNRDELEQLAPGVNGGLSEGGDDAPTRARRLIARYNLRGLLLTLGEAGALALTAMGDSESITPTPATEIVDTVGAGDAFTSVFLLGHLRNWPLAVTLKRAQDFASAIVCVRGATVADHAFYQRLLNEWSES